jgi:hypothetical protein
MITPTAAAITVIELVYAFPLATLIVVAITVVMTLQ